MMILIGPADARRRDLRAARDPGNSPQNSSFFNAKLIPLPINIARTHNSHHNVLFIDPALQREGLLATPGLVIELNIMNFAFTHDACF